MTLTVEEIDDIASRVLPHGWLREQITKNEYDQVFAAARAWVEHYEEHIDPQEKELLALRAEVEDLKRQRNELLGDCHTYVEENGNLRAEVERLTRNQGNYSDCVDAIEVTIPKLRARIEELQGQIIDGIPKLAAKQLAEADSRIVELERDADNLDAALRDAAESIQGYQNDLFAAHARIAELEAKTFDDPGKAIDRLAAERDRFHARIAELEEIVQTIKEDHPWYEPEALQKAKARIAELEGALVDERERNALLQRDARAALDGNKGPTLLGG